MSNSSSSTGILETIDGGAPFRLIQPNWDLPLAFDPLMSGRVYGYQRYPSGDNSTRVGYYVIGQSFEISEDGGRTWRYPRSNARIPTVEIAVDPAGSGRIYGFGALGMYRSDDRAETWPHLSGTLGPARLTGGAVP